MMAMKRGRVILSAATPIRPRQQESYGRGTDTSFKPSHQYTAQPRMNYLRFIWTSALDMRLFNRFYLHPGPFTFLISDCLHFRRPLRKFRIKFMIQLPCSNKCYIQQQMNVGDACMHTSTRGIIDKCVYAAYLNFSKISRSHIQLQRAVPCIENLRMHIHFNFKISVTSRQIKHKTTLT